MKDNNLAYSMAYQAKLKKSIEDKRLSQLFAVIPSMSITVYNQTTQYYANKKYEELLESGKTLPHGFYTVLEDEMRINGVLPTLRKYEEHINSICEVLQIDKKDFVKIMQQINKASKSPSSSINPDEVNARAELREIIRKYTSIYKEYFLKSIRDEKEKKLKETLTAIKKEDPNKKILSYEDYINQNIDNPFIINAIKRYLKENLGIITTDLVAGEILKLTFSKDKDAKLRRTEELLNLQRPAVYEEKERNKSIMRLRKSFTSKLNEAFSNATIEEKQCIATYINASVTTKRERANKNTPVSQYKKWSRPTTAELSSSFISQKYMPLVEETSVLMYEAEANLTVDENGNFKFISASTERKTPFEEISAEDVAHICKTFAKKENILSKLFDKIYMNYKAICKSYKSMLGTDELPTIIEDDEIYSIDSSKWLNSDKIYTLISKIDLDKLHKLNPVEFEELRKFLVEKGLLWAYISGNIPAETIAKIVNNFNAIYTSMKNDDISIDNLYEIIRKSNLYDYADPITIGLIGIENVAKIINYNQFTGVKLTDEIIRSRLRKVVDLAVRAERIDHSSLPFRCDVDDINGYSLKRYKNNDPSIFISGIQTKTCYFVSVNENDLFFYTLLNKNGFVIKIVDSEGNFVARATCWRKNNVLMINGIRCANNQVLPENKDDMDKFKNIVRIVKIMADKIIESTKADPCPIDYVICNRAGLFENDCFENQFEEVNALFFSEPIDVYHDDWDKFVHLYDHEPEQMLQEVPSNPKHSFVTDFGNHYPAIMIASRDYRPLLSPRDISLYDQEAIYPRPRRAPKEYISVEITLEIVERLNRIKALSCFIGTETYQKEQQANYQLINDLSPIKNIILGEDWYIIINKDNTYEIVFANPTPIAKAESRNYIEKVRTGIEASKKEEQKKLEFKKSN